MAPRPGLAGGNVAPTQEELESFQAAVDKMWDLDVNRLQPGVDYEIEVRDRLTGGDGGLRCSLSWVARGSLHIGRFCPSCSAFQRHPLDNRLADRPDMRPKAWNADC